MSELGETYAALREHNQEKRRYNLHSSIGILEKNEVPVEELSPTHFRVGVYDFWPSTGLFINRKTGQRGRGVFNLLKKIKPEGK